MFQFIALYCDSLCKIAILVDAGIDEGNNQN